MLVLWLGFVQTTTNKVCSKQSGLNVQIIRSDKNRGVSYCFFIYMALIVDSVMFVVLFYV